LRKKQEAAERKRREEKGRREIIQNIYDEYRSINYERICMWGEDHRALELLRCDDQSEQDEFNIFASENDPLLNDGLNTPTPEFLSSEINNGDPRARISDGLTTKSPESKRRWSGIDFNVINPFYTLCPIPPICRPYLFIRGGSEVLSKSSSFVTVAKDISEEDLIVGKGNFSTDKLPHMLRWMIGEESLLTPKSAEKSEGNTMILPTFTRGKGIQKKRSSMVTSLFGGVTDENNVSSNEMVSCEITSVDEIASEVEFVERSIEFYKSQHEVLEDEEESPPSSISSSESKHSFDFTSHALSKPQFDVIPLKLLKFLEKWLENVSRVKILEDEANKIQSLTIEQEEKEGKLVLFLVLRDQSYNLTIFKYRNEWTSFLYSNPTTSKTSSSTHDAHRRTPF